MVFFTVGARIATSIRDDQDELAETCQAAAEDHPTADPTTDPTAIAANPRAAGPVAGAAPAAAVEHAATCMDDTCNDAGNDGGSHDSAPILNHRSSFERAYGNGTDGARSDSSSPPPTPTTPCPRKLLRLPHTSHATAAATSAAIAAPFEQERHDTPSNTVRSDWRAPDLT